MTIEISRVMDELEALATSGTRMPGFRGKVMVDASRLIRLADELRRSIPMDMQEAREIIRQKDSIINQANMEAQRIRDSASKEAESLTAAARMEHESKVGESEVIKAAEQRSREIKEEATLEAQQIIQDAQRRAYRILDEAEAAANARRDGADQYAREVLFNLEERLSEVLGQVRRGIDSLAVKSENHVAA